MSGQNMQSQEAKARSSMKEMSLRRKRAQPTIAASDNDSDESDAGVSAQKDLSEIRTLTNHVMQSSGDGPARLCSIEKVVMRNFMCHDHLEIPLQNSVNFITGTNGSGKSAVMTAVMVGLGANTAATKRGTNLSSLIKTGKHYAQIEITINNKCLNPFKRDVYGDKIIVFRELKSQGSVYKLKTSSGKVISNRSCELKALRSKLNINVLNNVAFMTQEHCKSFLGASSGDKLFKMFYSATLLELIEDKYEKLLFDDDKVKKLTKTLKRQYRTEKKVLDEAVEMYRKADQIDVEIKLKQDIENQIQWFAVTNLVKTSESLSKKKSDMEKKIETEQTKVDAMRKKIVDLNAKRGDLRKAVDSLEEKEKTLEEEQKIVTEQFAKERSQIMTAQNRLKSKQASLSAEEREVSALKAHHEKQARQNKNIETTKLNYQRDLERLTTERRAACAKVDEVKSTQQDETEELEAVRGRHTRLSSELHKIGAQLRSLENQSGPNDLSQRYGDNIARLVNALRSPGNGFSSPPKGPVGALLKLKPGEDASKWTPVIEKTIGGLMNAFIVSTNADRMKLQELCRSLRIPSPTVYIIPFSARCPHIREGSRRGNDDLVCSQPGFSTILDLLTITDDAVGILLVEVLELARILFGDYPKNEIFDMYNSNSINRRCKSILLINGDKVQPSGSSMSFYPNKARLTSRYLVADLKHVQEDCKRQYEAVKVQKDSTEEELHRIQQRSRAFDQRLNSVMDGVRRVDAQIREVKQRLANLSNDSECFLDENELRERCRKIEEDRTAINAQLREISDQEREFNQKVKSTTGSDQLRVRIEKARQESNKARDELRTIADRMASAKQDATKCSLEKDRLARQLEEVATKVDDVNTRREAKIAELRSKNVPEVYPTEANASIDTLNEKVANLTQQIENHAHINQSLRVEQESRLAKVTSLTKRLENLRQVRELISHAIAERQTAFERLKIYLARKCKAAFKQCLAQNKYEGSIDINYETKSIDLKVHTATNKQATLASKATSVKTSSMRSLSGGERSFSTIALILSIWECTVMPIRILDEFDVFMDHQNRNLALRLIVLMAKKNGGQYTFLTPLGLGIPSLENQVSVWHMPAAVRKSKLPADTSDEPPAKTSRVLADVTNN